MLKAFLRTIIARTAVCVIVHGASAPALAEDPLVPFNGVYTGKIVNWTGGWARIRLLVGTNASTGPTLVSNGVIYDNGNFAIPLPGNAAMTPLSYDVASGYKTDACTTGNVVVTKNAQVDAASALFVYRNGTLIGDAMLADGPSIRWGQQLRGRPENAR